MLSSNFGPRELPQGVLAKFFWGARYPLMAFSFIRRNKLWLWTLAPTLINIILFVFVILGCLWLVLPWIDLVTHSLVTSMNSQGALTGLTSFLGKILLAIIWIIVPLVVLVLAAIFVVLVGQMVASPFLDLLSEKVEILVLKTDPLPFSFKRGVQGVAMAIGDLVWSLLFWLAVQLPLFIINFIPILGSFSYLFLGTAFTALLLSQEFVGLTLSRQLVPYRARYKLIWQNRSLALGFGSATLLLLLVPGLNLALLPLAAVGGSLLYCDLKAAGRVDLIAPPQIDQASS